MKLHTLVVLGSLFLSLTACGKGDDTKTNFKDVESSANVSEQSEGSVTDNGETILRTITTPSIVIKIHGLDDDAGKVMVAIYNDKKGFDDKAMWRGIVLQPKSKEALGVFRDLPAGTYGVSFFHDQNLNKKIDTNLFGIPTEKFGFSNDAMGSMGPPKWDQVTFEFNESVKTVSMKAKSFL